MRSKIKFFILLGILICLLLFMIISVSAGANYINDIDQAVFKLASKIRNLYINNLFLFFTLFGETLTIAIVLATLWFFPNRKEVALPLTITIILSTIFNAIIKIIVKRSRPVGQFASNLMFNYQFPLSYSFPSGHSQVGVVFYVILALCLLNTLNIKSKSCKILTITCASILSMLIGISRIILGVHFFSDVFTGWLIGIIIVLIFVFANKNANKFCIKPINRV